MTVKPPTLQQQAIDETTPPDRQWILAKESIELARLVANNPSADPELLQELGSSPDAATREGVANNPNTPTDVLIQLGAEFPAQLLENPVFSLLLLENPNLSTSMPLETLRSLVSQETVPELLLVEYAIRQSDWELLMRLTMNLKTPQNALARLVQRRHPEVAEAARLHVNWAGEMSEGWNEVGRAAIATIVTNLEEVKRSSKYRDQVQGLAAAGFILEEFVSHWQENDWALGVLQVAAESSRTNPRILEQLAVMDNPRIQFAIAANPKTPSHVLERLVRDTNPTTTDTSPTTTDTSKQMLLKRMREQLAQKNVQVPDSMLEMFLEIPSLKQSLSRMSPTELALHLSTEASSLSDMDSFRKAQNEIRLKSAIKIDIRRRVAANPNTSAKVLQQLAVDTQGDPNGKQVRHFVARNPNTPHHILEQLAQDPDYYTRSICASNPRLSASLLERLAGEPNGPIQDAVAKNPNTPLQILEQFARKGPGVLRVAVTRNPATPTRLLEQLAQDPDVRNTFIYNARAPEELLAQLLKQQDKPHTGIYQALARNPATPAYLFEHLRQLKDLETLEAIASNPNTPVAILESLLEVKSRDGQPTYMNALSKNPNLPENLWKSILHYDYAAKLPDEFPVIFSRFLNKYPEKLPLVLEYYAKSPSLLVRLIVLLHPQTPSQLLAEATRSLHWTERYAAAQHSNTPLDRLKFLAQDSNRVVRAAAIAHLWSITRDTEGFQGK